MKLSYHRVGRVGTSVDNPLLVIYRQATLADGETDMHLKRLLSTVLMFFLSGPLLSGPLFAQEWMEFASREDRFACLFPEQPKITETTYRSEYGADLPARVYSVTQAQSRYSVT